MSKQLKKTAIATLLASCALLGQNAWASQANMVIAMPLLPTTVEPQGINNNAIDRVMSSVYDTLIRANSKTGALEPGLALSWKRISADTVEFKLRRDVKFHDGTPFTADDVVFSFGPERFSSEKAPGRPAAWEFLGGLKSVKKIDNYTVRVTMKTPDPLIELRFSARMSEIISEDGFKKAGSWENWVKKPIGSGPYKIVSFKTSNRLELVRNDQYWGDKGAAQKVSFVEVPELSARVAGLRSGEFDIITEVPPDQIKPLSSDGKVNVVGGPIANVYGMVFDTQSSEVMKNPKLRQAILHAIDRDLLVSALFANKTTAANSFQLKMFGDLYLSDLDQKLYDPAKAKALLKEANYKGEPIIWKIQTGYYTLEMTVSQAVASMLKSVGLNVELQVKENWSQVEASGKDRMINNASFSAYFNDPASQLWRRMKPKSSWDNMGYLNTSGQAYKTFQVNGEILETNTDLAQRKAAWAQMLQAFAQDPQACPLYALPMIYATQRNVTWTPGTDGRMDLTADSLSFK